MTTALPTQVTYGTFKGKLIDAINTGGGEASRAVTGTVTATPAVNSVNIPAALVVMLPRPVTVTLDANGAFTMQLVATDDPALSVLNWAYQISFQLNNGDALAPFLVQIPGGTSVDLSTANPVSTGGGVAITQGSAGPAGPTALFDADAVPYLNATAPAPTGPGVQPANKRLVTEASALLASKVARDTITVLASDHGVVGDGVTDDGPALNTLLDSAVAAGREVSLTPGSTVRTTVSITPPSGTRLNLNGATIKSACPGVNDRLIVVNGKANVKIYGGTLDGDKASFAAVTEFRHNVHITNSSNVTLRDIITTRAKGDGVFVGDGISGFSSDIVLDRVTSDGNHRQGLSISTVKGFVALGCRFINTSGTSPQSGVDIEPDADNEPIERIRFVGCEFAGNTGSGAQVSLRATPTLRQEGIDFTGCTFHDNTMEGVVLVCARKVRFMGGEITGNGNHGVWFSSTVTPQNDVTFSGVAITKNARQGILTDSAFNRLTVEGCTVTENGQTVASIGIDLGTSYASVDARIVGTTSGGAPQNYGLRTNSNLSLLTLVGNSYVGNTVGPVSLGDDVTTRVRMDGSGFDLAPPSAFAAKSTYTGPYGNSAIGVRTTGDTVDRIVARTDGAFTFSSGAAAQDTILSRLAAGVLGLGVGQAFRSGTTTTARPTPASVGVGSQMYDTTLSKPIWSDGTVWRDAAGAAV